MKRKPTKLILFAVILLAVIVAAVIFFSGSKTSPIQPALLGTWEIDYPAMYQSGSLSRGEMEYAVSEMNLLHANKTVEFTQDWKMISILYGDGEPKTTTTLDYQLKGNKLITIDNQKKAATAYQYRIENHKLYMENKTSGFILVYKKALQPHDEPEALIGSWVADYKAMYDAGLLTQANYDSILADQENNAAPVYEFTADGHVTLTQTSTLYPNPLVYSYTYTLENDTLSLIDTEDGREEVYQWKLEENKLYLYVPYHTTVIFQRK